MRTTCRRKQDKPSTRRKPRRVWSRNRRCQCCYLNKRMMMTQRIDLRTLLGNASDDRLALFAWLNLGIVKSLTKSILKPEDAVRIFFHGDNCLFVKTEFGEETAEKI